MKTQNAVIAALLGLGLLAPGPALAQAPDLGPDWELSGTRKVKNWIAHPANPEDGEWELVDHNTYRIFQENLENPAPDMPALPAPEIQKGAVKRGAPYEEKGGVDRVRKGLMVHKYQTIVTVTPQTQVQTTINKGWKLSEFTRQETRSRALRTKYGLYDISFQVPVKNFRWDVIETGRSSRDVAVDPLRSSRVVELLPPERSSEVSSLANADGNRPSAFRGDASSGGKSALSGSQLRQNMGANQVKASAVLTPEQIEEARKKAEAEELARQEAENQAQAAAEEARRKELEAEALKQRENKEATESTTPKQATGNSKGTDFIGNAVNKTVKILTPDFLEDSQRGSGLTLEKVLGTWTVEGGKSSIGISQVGKSKNMKVTTNLTNGKTTFKKTLNSVAFGKTWQADLGKDANGKSYYVKATFNDKGDEMDVQLVLDEKRDSVVAKGTFTKKK